MTSLPQPFQGEAKRLIRTYRFRLKPTAAQHNRLRAALVHSRQLYNAALEERIDCYRKTGKGRTYFDQTAALTQLRKEGTPFAWGMEAPPLNSTSSPPKRRTPMEAHLLTPESDNARLR